MATVAELKARLAKHAAAATKPGGILNENTAPAGGTPDERGGSVRSEGLGKVQDYGVATPGAQDLLVASVQTDLQPATLTVVERPAVGDSGVSDTLRGGTLQGSEAREPTNLDGTNPVHQSFLQRLADLEVALLHRDPLMKTHLGQIHKTMIEYEEIANLLTVDEIRQIMAAQQVHTNVVLAGDVKKAGKAAANKRAAQISLNDI